MPPRGPRGRGAASVWGPQRPGGRETAGGGERPRERSFACYLHRALLMSKGSEISCPSSSSLSSSVPVNPRPPPSPWLSSPKWPSGLPAPGLAPPPPSSARAHTAEFWGLHWGRGRATGSLSSCLGQLVESQREEDSNLSTGSLSGRSRWGRVAGLCSGGSPCDLA